MNLCDICAYPVRCSNMERCLQGKVTPPANPSLDVKPKPQHVNTESKPKMKSKLKKVVKK